MELGTFSHVASYITKAESNPDIPDKDSVIAGLSAAQGLINFKGKIFKKAANNFISIPFASFRPLPYFTQMDVALYGGICALSTFDRQELKTRVVENSDFKQFLEVEPQVSELIHSFYNSKYKQCLEIMELLKNDLLLDINIAQYAIQLLDDIRKRAIIQYFSPYLSVDLTKMAQSFNTSSKSLEKELSQLITTSKIEARIDSHNKVLIATKQNEKRKAYQNTLKMSADYRLTVKVLMLRAKLVKADMVVKPASFATLVSH
jgi:COP9 signalosome complex subunit 1